MVSAPAHPIAVQGPTDPGNLYVWVTWDRNDPTATSYKVYRDGVLLTTVTVSGDTWDKCAYKDTTVSGSTSYDYRVAASDGSTTSPKSRIARVYVRTNADFGSVVNVGAPTGGNDLTIITTAVNTAITNGGGIVQFNGSVGTPAVYKIATKLQYTSKNVVLRGGGIDATIIEHTGGSATNVADAPMIDMLGSWDVVGTISTGAINVGDRTHVVTSTSGLSVGMIILFDQMFGGSGRTLDGTAGAIQDPANEEDNTNSFELNEITAISGTTVTFRYPFSQQFTSGVRWDVLAEPSAGQRKDGNVVEQMTLRGVAANTTYRTLLQLTSTSTPHIAEVKFLEPNRMHIESFRCWRPTIVGCQAPDLGDLAFSGTTRYGFNLAKSINARVVACTLGTDGSLLARSHFTIGRSQRAVVRHCTFYDSDTYALNEHGGGTRHFRFENCYIKTPSAGFGGVLLGNETFSFTGPGVVRNLRMVNCGRDFQLIENSYGLRILDIVSSGCAAELIQESGWGNDSVTPTQIVAGDYGAVRLSVVRYTATTAALGFDLGVSYVDSNFPYVGVKDVVIRDCALGTTGLAIRLQGDSTDTQRFQVSGVTGTNNYTKPSFVSGDYWSGNADGASFGTPTAVTWTTEVFDWETLDTVLGSVDEVLGLTDQVTQQYAPGSTRIVSVLFSP